MSNDGNSLITQINKLIEINSDSNLKYINKEDIINYISLSFESIIHNNKTMGKKQIKINDPFYSKNIPVLSLNKYLIRIMKYTECENNTLIVAYLYIIKLIQKNNFVLGINNIYRLLLGSITLAKKVLEDIRLDNAYYCNIGGISAKELNIIEYNLFIKLNFDINLKRRDIYKVYEQILKNLPPKRLYQIFQEEKSIDIAVNKGNE